MDPLYKTMTDFLLGLGVDKVDHTSKSFLAHLIGVFNFMRDAGCTEELCRAGMFHSIYGTESFQRFSLPVERRPEVRELIGERAEHLAYLNCAMDRPSFDRALERAGGPHPFRNRLTGEEILLTPTDFDDLCRLHLYDWLEQVPRSEKWGWNYRRASYRRMAARLGPRAEAIYERVFALEPVGVPS